MKSRNAQRTFHPVLLLVFQIIRNWTLGTCVLEHKQWIAFFFMMPYQIQVEYCCRKYCCWILYRLIAKKVEFLTLVSKFHVFWNVPRKYQQDVIFFFRKSVKHCASSEFSSEFSKAVFAKFQLKIFLDLYALCIFISSVLLIKAPTYSFK